METGGPTGVVDSDVDKNRGLTLMDCIHQLDELLKRCGPRIEFGQCRINGCKTKGCIRAAKASHPGIGGRRGMDRQQLDNPASQLTDDEIQFFYQITKGS